MSQADKETRKKRWWTTGAVLENLDSFGEPLPTFNIKGKDQVQTQLGGFVTLALILVVTMFAIVKFEQLTSKYNPQMSSFFLDIPDEKLNLNEKNFRIAFSVEDYIAPKKLKNSPEFTKSLFQMYGKKDGKAYERVLDAHICTESDYAEFNPIQEASAGVLKEIKTDPDRGFYCLDWDESEPFEIYGNENDDNYQRLEFQFLPCNSVSTDIGLIEGELAAVNPKCEESLERQLEYIGKSNILILVDTERFRPELFGENKLEKTSVIINQQVQWGQPSWLSTLVQSSELQDEIGTVQFGFDETSEFLTYRKEILQPSAWDDHPSRNATGLYKFVSVEVNYDRQLLVITRQTYDLLSLLGDIGGLTDALFMLGKFILGPFTSFSLQSLLLTSLFRMQPSLTHEQKEKSGLGTDEASEKDETKKQEFTSQFTRQFTRQETSISKGQILSHLKRSFQEMQNFGSENFMRHFLSSMCCFCRNKSKNFRTQRYKRFLEKSQSQMTREMDLKKFITRQRLYSTALLGLLSGRQTFFADKMSQMVIEEDGDSSDDSSSEDDQLDQNRVDVNYAAKLVASTSQVDKRFVREYMISKACQHNTRFGFENDMLLSNYPMSKDQGIATTPQVKRLISPHAVSYERVQTQNLRIGAKVQHCAIESSTKGPNNSILPQIMDKKQAPSPLLYDDTQRNFLDDDILGSLYAPGLTQYQQNQEKVQIASQKLIEMSMIEDELKRDNIQKK